MTQKQENILTAALKLFAQEGYASTSTQKVAREAGVSEGLIFRHFGSKEGLLSAIMRRSEEETKRLMAGIVMTTDPKEMLRKALELPFSIGEDQYEMWRLTYALKWQTDQYNLSAIEPLKIALRHSFKSLGYADPDAECEALLMFIDGAATAILLHEPEHKTAILTVLKSKYNLQ
jgi:AcrR family transcriptional regulator